MNIIQDLKQDYKSGGITMQIIIWNVLLFVVSIPFFYNFNFGLFEYPNWITLSSMLDVFIYKPWTVITYQFFHFSFWHLFFNMLMLNFTSRLFLTFFNPKQFFSVYLLGGILGGVFFLLGYYFLNLNGELIGASASIMAVLLAVTTYNPIMPIRIPLLGYFKLWHITVCTIVVSDILEFKLLNTGGHLAHLGGALFGFIYTKSLVNGVDLGKGLNLFLDWLATLFSSKSSTPFKKVHKNSIPKKPVNSTSRIVTKDRSQQQIDEILDKISQSGYDSLTKEEKEFLFKAGK